ncbi:Phage integrase family, partial [human gut metagenome]
EWKIDIIYFSDFPNLQETGTRKDNGKFDLTLLPTQELKEEFRGYIMYRCKNGTFRALIQDRTAYNHIAKFLNSRINRRIKSLGDRNPEKWISLLKGWMLEQGITIVKEKKSVYGTVSYGEAVTILYFRNVLKFLGPEDLRDEIEKDVWELKNLDIKIRSNPIYNVKILDFRKIYQPDIREECKKAVYMNLQYEAIGTVQGELTIMRIFSEYLQKEYSKIKSCSEIDREVLEEFLIDTRMQKYAEDAARKQMKQVQQNFNNHWSIRRTQAGKGKWMGQEPWQDENHQVIPNFIQGIAERQPFYKDLVARFPDNPDSVNYYYKEWVHPVKVFDYDKG